MAIVRAAASLLATTWAIAASAAEEAPPAGAVGAELEEIVVTAQRRSERLVDVPITVALVSSSELERVGGTSLESLNKLVPGIYLQRDIYGLSPTVRGIGSTLSSSGGESNVSVYMDGVYLPFKATNIFDLASVANVQVLKGPQGTLFGRNATGGAILVTTLDPSFEAAGKLRASYERFGQARTSGYVNVPITDQFAANAAVSYRHSDGYIRDSRTNELVNEGEDYSGRVKFLWQPSDSFSVMLGAYLSRFDDPTGSSYQAITTAPFFSLPGIDTNAGPIARDRYHRSHNAEDAVETQAKQYTLHIDWDLGFATLQSVTSSQNGELESLNDLDSTYQDLVPAANARVALKTEFDTITQEVNLTSKPGAKFDYVAGLFYYDNEGTVPYLRINDVPQFTTVGDTTAKSVYFDGTYHLGDWGLIAGIRYTRETRDLDTRFFPAGQKNASATESVWTPRVGARYEITPYSNVYATFTRGYKAGIFDATSLTGNKVDPEYVNAYEIGYKSSSADFTLNTAVYYYDFTDTQVNAVFSNGGQIYQQLFNVPESEIYGLDIDGTYRFNEAFDIRTSLAYTHARYKEFTNAPGYAIDPTDAASGFGLFYASTSVDASGSNMVRAPEWSASAALNYHVDLFGDARLDASVSGAYSSRVHFNFANTLSQPAYFLLDANATVSFNEHLAVSLFGRNLTDKVYFTTYSQNALSTAATFGMPRTYGVSIDYTF
ncbi:MAG TPA: TonB-dependent receptor [Steroidobacter sp.]|uniref:TonB-dependent receptor n=1 Tax=Steroidobacter sp. TaxID=1978227 RepID=UPI002ED86623